MATATASKTYSFEPDYAVAPGRTLQETLNELGLDQKDFATRTGLSAKTINLIIHGHAPITPDTAMRFERVTGVPARVWNDLEMKYREQLARLQDRKRLNTDLTWMNSIPVRELAKRGLINENQDEAGRLVAVLSFFGVSSSQTWKQVWLSPSASFRKSKCFTAQPGPTAAWLRLGELEAQKIECSPYDKGRFRGCLDEARQLTLLPPDESQRRLVNLCADAGVALVFVREFAGCPMSGVARWLTSEKALIQMSLRYRTDDHMWFTFFHEASHILHDHKKDVFIDDDGQTRDDCENRADKFAEDFLIPSKYASHLGQLTTREAIRSFATSIGIAPGIVVGRLQKQKIITYAQFNDLKRMVR